MTNAGPENHSRTELAVQKATPGLPAFATPRFTRTSSAKIRSGVLSAAVMTLVVPGLFATVALPAYAISPVDKSGAEASTELQAMKKSDAQNLSVASAAASLATARDGFSATTPAELEVARAAEAEAAAAAAAAAVAASGPSISDLLANPPYPSFDLNQVVAVGEQYIGTPYVFGGADPSGFDCSGFIKFVYAQFGVNLAHSVTAQAAAGTRIATADAVPGDLVIMSGHDGIYMGDGMIMDAPKPGGFVSIRPIWTTSFSIVRIGV